MRTTTKKIQATIKSLAIILAVLSPTLTLAQTSSGAHDVAKASAPGPTLQKLSGVWVEGPGYDITYGGTYDACASRCQSNARCVMIEYYRPEKKCNMYDKARKTLTGGSSDVGIRTSVGAR